MTQATSTLFVYGTLRRRSRLPMARMLVERAAFLGEAKTAGRLYDLGRFPAAVPTEIVEEWIFGDLYRLDLSSSLLEELDRYENGESPADARFERRIANVILLPEVSPAKAWIYWFVGPMPQARQIASGRYDKNFSEP